MQDMPWWVPFLPLTTLLIAAQVTRRHRGRGSWWYGGLAVMALALLGQAWIADVTVVRVALLVLAVVVVPLGHLRRPRELRH